MHDAPNHAVGQRRRAPVLLLLAWLSLALVWLSACAGDEDGDASTLERTVAAAASDVGPAEEAPADVEMAPMEAGPESADADTGPEAETGDTAPAALTPADLGRDIVYRATVSVQADDVTAASNEAVAIVQGLGGIVFNQTTRTEPRPSAELTFKVLPRDFRTALERLAGVGKPVDESISADDVTERVVDLESRISTAETSVTRLRRLLDEAGDLEDVAQIERELLDRETTLE
ncbi:MAG: DUF4349 domain-containing protein, partial [Acidimicrobiaceae bacterium]|nr:DUF4349 domain-containing protein [Acidimicrobiaceae bacterium]